MTVDERTINLLQNWWEWSRVNSGMPRGYSRRSGGGPAPQISDDAAMEVEKTVCQLKKRMPDEEAALLAFLRCGGNIAETARRLRISTNTARLRIQTALAWLDRALIG